MSREGMQLVKGYTCPKCSRRKCWLLGDGVSMKCCKCGHRFVLK